MAAHLLEVSRITSGEKIKVGKFEKSKPRGSRADSCVLCLVLYSCAEHCVWYYTHVLNIVFVTV